MTVTIIGAGIVGCAIAYELASRGAAVHVVDARGIAKGATQASAGILAPRIEGHSDPLLQLAVSSLGLYDGFVSRLRADASHSLEYERNGTLQVARDRDEASALRAMAERLSTRGVSHSLIEGAPLAALEPELSSRGATGLLLPDEGYIVPDDFAQALAEAAVRRGATFVTSRAYAVRADGRRTEVATDTGGIRADVVVVAGGSWSSELEGIPGSPVRPIRGQLIHLFAERRLASRVIWGARCYIVPRLDGSVLVGATVEDSGFDETATAFGVRTLLNAAADLLPALDRARFRDVRVGLRPMTKDELPAIGFSSTMPQVVYAIGHYRNGVLLAPLTALLVADLVLEGRERPELALTRPARLGL